MMIGAVIFCLMVVLPPTILLFILSLQEEQEKRQKNRRMNEERHVKIEYELDVFDFVKEETARLENEHNKKIKKITKKYGSNFLLYAMSPDDLDEYMREQSHYRQKVNMLHEGLGGFYKNRDKFKA